MGNINLHLRKVTGKIFLVGSLFISCLSAVDAQTTPPANGQAKPDANGQAASGLVSPGGAEKNTPFPHPRTIDGKPINIGIVYPISTNGWEAGKYVNGLSLNAIVGLSGGETGVAAAGLSDVIL